MALIKKKSLGQHFLRSEAALKAIIEAIEPGPLDIVLEIGPGEGVLTEKLLPLAGRVLAIEKDRRLIPILHEIFAPEVALKKLIIVEKDALMYDPQTLKTYITEGFTYKVVGNIPYYITGALLRKFLESPLQPTKLVFLMQREVAERIVGRDKGKKTGKESLLSLSIKAYGTPTYVKTVPKGAFVPAPTVDSAILLVDDISRAHFTNTFHEERFFALIHAGFAQKRKLLMRNIEELMPKERAEEAFAASNIPPNARAEDVSIEQWLKLAEF